MDGPGRCPYDGSPLSEIGDCGIVDWDGRWEAQTSRYRCGQGHMIFVALAEPIDFSEEEATRE